MLTEDELLDLCQRHQLTEFAVATVRNIRGSDPSRNVRSGTHNVVTHYASRKMGFVVKAEARSTELAALFHWDHDSDTYEFYDQPPRIKKIHTTAQGRVRATSYTPDFFVIAKHFVGWVECKEESWLFNAAQLEEPQYMRDPEGKWRCPAAEAYAQEQGLKFAVMSSADYSAVLIQNISDLSDYYRPDCPPVGEASLAQADKLLADSGWCWLRDLLNNDVGLKADEIFKMIADEQVFVDLSATTLMDEAHRVRVFRTRLLLESSALWLPALSAPVVEGIPQVTMVSGAALLWDGSACEILNVGKSHVYLKTAEVPLLKVDASSFAAMVREGSITAEQRCADPRAERAADKLRNATDEDFKSAMHRYHCLHPETCPPDEPPHTASARAIRKWRALARSGVGELGNEFVALLPCIGNRGNRERRLDERSLTLMHQVIDEEVTSKNRSGHAVSWSILVAKCEKEGRLPPSRRTFEEEIRRVKTPEELKKAREGEKAGYNLELPYLTLERTTPRHGCRPFGLAHIDHTQLDLQFVDESFGRSMKKAWLTVLLDAYARNVLAWVILFDEPSYRSCMLAIRDCVRRHGRVPQTIVADQGSDFKSKYFDMLLAFLGVHKRMRPGSQPRYGGVIERFFGLSNTDFVHALRGNNQALQSPRSMSASHDPVALAVWNLRAFRESFERYLEKVYHATEHPALGVSPSKVQEIGMLQTGTRAHTLIPYGREFVIATLPSTPKGTVKIQDAGSFQVNSIDYYSPDLVMHARSELEVKYDPFDASRAYVMTNGGWVEGTSTFAGLLAGRSIKEIEAISLEINELCSRTGLRGKEKASLLGDFITSIREREGELVIDVQAARDREQRAAYADNGLMDTPHDEGQGIDLIRDSNVVELKPERRIKADSRKKQSEVFNTAERQVWEDFE